MRQRGAWILAAVMVGLTGCVPLPLALPPVKAGVAVMGAQKALPEDDFVLAGLLEVGLFPWQFIEAHGERTFDLGLGYRGTFGDVGPSIVGPYLEGAWFPLVDEGLRIGTHIQLQALSQSGLLHIDGAGLAVRQSIELFTFVSEPVDSCNSSSGCFLGIAHGESGGALYVEAGAGALSGRGVWHISAGLTLRIPATVGIALVPLF